jgi:ComF family protein
MKFGAAREACSVLGEMMSSAIGILPKEAVIVPVPTASSHIRERGFDHAALLARRIAHVQGVRLEQPLARMSRTKQRGLGREERFENAANAFKMKGLLKTNVPYLLVDDVATTGASLNAASRLLKQAGAQNVWVAVAARRG